MMASFYVGAQKLVNTMIDQNELLAYTVIYRCCTNYFYSNYNTVSEGELLKWLLKEMSYSIQLRHFKRREIRNASSFK